MCNSPEEQESLAHVGFTRAAPSWPAWDTKSLVSSHVCQTAALGLSSSSWDNQSLRADWKNFFLLLSRCFSTNCFCTKRIIALSDWCCVDEVSESHMLDPWGSTTNSTKGLSAKETMKTKHKTILFCNHNKVTTIHWYSHVAGTELILEVTNMTAATSTTRTRGRGKEDCRDDRGVESTCTFALLSSRIFQRLRFW